MNAERQWRRFRLPGSFPVSFFGPERGERRKAMETETQRTPSRLSNLDRNAVNAERQWRPLSNIQELQYSRSTGTR